MCQVVVNSWQRCTVVHPLTTAQGKDGSQIHLAVEWIKAPGLCMSDALYPPVNSVMPTRPVIIVIIIVIRNLETGWDSPNPLEQ